MVTKIHSISLSPVLSDRLKEFSDKTGLSRSSIVTKAVEEFLPMYARRVSILATKIEEIRYDAREEENKNS